MTHGENSNFHKLSFIGVFFHNSIRYFIVKTKSRLGVETGHNRGEKVRLMCDWYWNIECLKQ